MSTLVTPRYSTALGDPLVLHSFQRRLDATVAQSYPFEIGGINYGHYMQPRLVVIKTLRAVGVSSDCEISVGTNSPDYDNILKKYVIRPTPEAWERIQLSVPIFSFLDDPTVFQGPVGDFDLRIKVGTPATATQFDFFAWFAYDPTWSFITEEGFVVPSEQIQT